MEKTADAQMPTVGSQSPTFEMVAKTLYGLEDVLAGELTALGANDIQIGRRMVSFTGDKELLYRANFTSASGIISRNAARRVSWACSIVSPSTCTGFKKGISIVPSG